MQESFWWWECSDRYIISLSHHLCTPFSPSLISLTVSVDVKHHVYFLFTFTKLEVLCVCVLWCHVRFGICYTHCTVLIGDYLGVGVCVCVCFSGAIIMWFGIFCIHSTALISDHLRPYVWLHTLPPWNKTNNEEKERGTICAAAVSRGTGHATIK